MADFYFKLNRAGVRELLNSEEMHAVLNEKAGKVLHKLPHGYGITDGKTSQRAKATVGTRTIDAYFDNKHNNTLLKALGGAND